MPRAIKPTFVVELPLVVQPAQDLGMIARFEAGRRLYNAVLGDALKALGLMRQSKAWQAATVMPKGNARNTAFNACNTRFGFTEYALHAIATKHKNAAGFDDRLGAHETQKIATRVFAAVQQYAFGKRGRTRFRGMHRPLHSLEGKSNAAGIRWSADTGTVTWGKGFALPARLPTKAHDPTSMPAWPARPNTAASCGVCKMEGAAGLCSWCKPARRRPSTSTWPAGRRSAWTSAPAKLPWWPMRRLPWKRLPHRSRSPGKMRRLQRAQDRSRRSTNPDNYASDGTVKTGAKGWVKSARYRARQRELGDLERRLAAGRKRDHGELANKILGLGNLVQTEKLSYKGLQKSFGRSAKVRASGMFVSLLIRKAERAGGKVVELSTRGLKMSQYDHTTGVCTKKPLSLRWHDLGHTGVLVQRDCYSAFLAKNVVENQHKSSRLDQSWAAAKPLLRRAGLCADQSESGARLRVPTVGIPSDRIARQRRFVRGHARDAVVARREPEGPVYAYLQNPPPSGVGMV